MVPPVIGGWMYAALQGLRNHSDATFAVAALYGGTQVRTFEADGVRYFLLPRRNDGSLYDQALEEDWKEVHTLFAPDLVHIHGSEFPHGLAYLNACGSKNALVSIQGLVSVYERYFFGGISDLVLLRNVTFRDVLRMDTIFSQRRRMKRRSSYELEMLRLAPHVSGRTEWDNAHAWAINPQARYHHCNETLRRGFYGKSWSQDECETFSIFLSQAHYPIKGLQQVVAALPLILREFPQTKVHVAGTDFFSGSRWRRNGFSSHILKEISKASLEGVFHFTGGLDEEKMVDRYLRSHVFVCPSAIENSPNSVGEAQLLGVPCVAALVGGVSDFMVHRESGLLYRYDEPELLAHSVCEIFRDFSLAETLSRGGQERAKLRHDASTNATRLSKIYEDICSA